MEVSPSDDVDPADTAGLPQLFSDASSFPSSDPAADIPVAAASHPSTTHLDSSVPVDFEDNGVVWQCGTHRALIQRPQRRRNNCGEWVAHWAPVFMGSSKS